MKNDITFEHYLHRYGHTLQTVKSYVFANKIFMMDNPSPENYKYKDIVEYLNKKVDDYSNSNTKVYLLNGIKKYYDYLLETGKREDHPCRNFFVRNQRNKQVIHQDLFSSKELELMLEREERYADLQQRNQVVTSLLIYQGLHSREIHNLNLSHIDLDSGLIFIKASPKVSQRHIEINNKQYRLFDRYLHEGRKALLRDDDNNAFVLGKLGTRMSVDDIHYLVSTFKGLFPDRKLTPATIRQSVIANWLNEKKLPLEQVQLLSGQKWISTTIKYKQVNVDEQRKLMNRFHPLG
ncbi:MAG: tyrosine-type recombinase/integrase [Bacteroidota bacterium]|nr:tyrosine-type recombinase/integrase [Bacteroidota bacterium]MDP3558387.1 tyrosine-type recombinase/integrase [Bacteroidota bacterium]